MPILGVSAAIGLYCGVEPRQNQPEPTASRKQKIAIACSVAALKTAINNANAATGAQVIDLPPSCDITLNTVDNYWYGPNGLPPILNDITINGDARYGTSISRSVGGSVPAFRLFYVAGNDLPPKKAGKLTLRYVTLAGGLAKGGDSLGNSHSGGGGLGAGGAIFSHGETVLVQSLVLANTARGGKAGDDTGGASHTGGGGMGGNGHFGGGGFRAATNANGGHGVGTTEGGLANGTAGTSAAGTEDGTAAATTNGGAGGGTRQLGGRGGDAMAAGTGAAGGDGGGGGGAETGSGGGGGGAGFGGNGGSATGLGGGGGGFGGGGAQGDATDAGGGGGVGGGGGGGNTGLQSGGGGGGFGGGGGAGYVGGNGGFGGGGGGSTSMGGTGGFGGGSGGKEGAITGLASGGGGAGLGGAIFVHGGTFSAVNSTIISNSALGGLAGASGNPGTDGQGLGGAIFNLNGTVNLTNVTLSANTTSSTTDAGGALYVLSYGKEADGTTDETATAAIKNSILANSSADDIVVNKLSGAATIDVSNTNTNVFETAIITKGGASVTGTGTPIIADPMLAALDYNNGPTRTHLLQTGSPALNAGDDTTCSASPVNGVDQRGFQRPGTGCDIGGAEVGANGSYCAATTDCVSGFCVDGYCCNQACGGGAYGHCQACYFDAGASADGICTRLGAGSTCRASNGSCDIEETCDGSSDACPPDTFERAGFMCDPGGIGECDAPDYCDGTSPECKQRYMPDTTICRPSQGPCDLVEKCDGTSWFCPPNARKSGGTICRISAGPCDQADACDGSNPDCPDAKKSAGVICKPPGANITCDPEDYCDGIRSTCPARYAKSGTSCGAPKKCNGFGSCL